VSRTVRPFPPERISNPIDVVEPRRDQRDLQDPGVVKADGAQAGVVLVGDPLSAPARMSAPQTVHRPIVSAGDDSEPLVSAGVRKMPTAIVWPTTSASSSTARR